MKVTYTLEVEIPDNATAREGAEFVREIQDLLRWKNQSGWRVKLGRLFFGVPCADRARQPRHAPSP